MLDLVKVDAKDAVQYVKFIRNYVHSFEYQESSVPFLGSQPIQVSKNIANHVISRDMFISPKLDGVRYNMFIDKHGLLLINRANDVFKLPFPTKCNISGSYLFDVEIFENTIFVFDVLLSLPKNIINKVYKKPFEKRLPTLFKLFENIKPVIDISFGNNVFIVPKTFYRLLQFTGKDYDDVLDLFSSEYPLSGKLMFDGIIFMNPKYMYYMNPQVGYGQYKWKPLEDLTVDLEYFEGKFFDKKGYEWNRVKSTDISNQKLENNKTYEFRVIQNGKNVALTLVTTKGPREKGPNSYLTLESVYNTASDFLKFKDISDAFNFTNEVSTTNLKWMNKEKSIQFAIQACGSKLVPDNKISKIVDGMIDIYKKKESYLLNYSVSKSTLDKIKIYSKFHRINENNLYSQIDSIIDEQLKSNLYSTMTDGTIGDYISKLHLPDYSNQDSFKLNSILSLVDKLTNPKMLDVPLIPKHSMVLFKTVINFMKLYEIGFRDILKKTKEGDKDFIIYQRMKNISSKNIDVKQLLFKLNRSKIKKVQYKEVEFSTLYKTKSGALISEIFKYDYNKSESANEQFSLKSYTDSNINVVNDIPLSDLDSIYDYNVFTSFTMESSGPILERKDIIKRNPYKIAHLQSKRYRKVITFVYSRYIKINIVFIKEFKNRVVRNEKGDIVMDEKGIPKLEWTKTPLRKSFIDVELNTDSIVDDFGALKRDFEYTTGSTGRSIKQRKPLKVDKEQIQDYLSSEINNLIRFIFNSIEF